MQSKQNKKLSVCLVKLNKISIKQYSYTLALFPINTNPNFQVFTDQASGLDPDATLKVKNDKFEL
jgi:hypothetical protein